MPTLEGATKDVIRLAKKMAEEQYRIKNDKIKTWRGKKIIPAQEWSNKVRPPVRPDYLQYMPDTFLDWVLFFGCPQDDESLKAQQGWYKVYIEYLEKTKNPEYGRHLCKQCPLSSISDSFGIGNIILRYLENTLKNYKYPCDVLNVFKCPHGFENTNFLRALGNVQRILDQAISYSCELTRMHDNSVYINFVSGRAGYENQANKITNQIWDVMKGRKVPRLPLRGIKTVHAALTRKDQVEILLDQYLDSLDPENGRVILDGTWFDTKYIRELKQPILLFLEDNNNLVMQEELTDWYRNQSQREERREQEEIEAEKKEIEDPRHGHELRDRRSSGVCVICNNLAKVYCVNCQNWVCVEHWEKHGLDQHNFTLKIPNYDYD